MPDRAQDNQHDTAERAQRSEQATSHEPRGAEPGEVPTPTGMGDEDGIGGASGAVAHGSSHPVGAR